VSECFSLFIKAQIIFHIACVCVCVVECELSRSEECIIKINSNLLNFFSCDNFHGLEIHAIMCHFDLLTAVIFTHMQYKFKLIKLCFLFALFYWIFCLHQRTTFFGQNHLKTSKLIFNSQWIFDEYFFSFILYVGMKT
jgi:hypothetical protein